MIKHKNHFPKIWLKVILRGLAKKYSKRGVCPTSPILPFSPIQLLYKYVCVNHTTPSVFVWIYQWLHGTSMKPMSTALWIHRFIVRYAHDDNDMYKLYMIVYDYICIVMVVCMVIGTWGLIRCVWFTPPKYYLSINNTNKTTETITQALCALVYSKQGFTIFSLISFT